VKLGAATLRMFPDLATAALKITDNNGDSVFSNAAKLVSVYTKAFADTQYRREGLEALQMFADGTAREILSDLMNHNAGGKIGAAADLVGTVTGARRHVEAARLATGHVISHELSKQSGKAWKDLGERWRRGLERYDLGESEWELIRRAVDDWGDLGAQTVPEGQRGFINADSIEALPDELVENYLRKNDLLEEDAEATTQRLDLARYKLSLKLGAFINDMADYGSTTPSTRTKAFMNQGYDADDGVGIALRLVGQFKQAMVTQMDAYRRSRFSGEGLEGNYANLVQAGVMSMFLWSIGEFAKQALDGKTPEDPMTVSFAGRAMVGSGFAGIYGDVLSQAAQQEGIFDAKGNIALSMLGPVPSALAETAALGVNYGRVATGYAKRDKYPNKEAAGFVTSTILPTAPLKNLLYTRYVYNFYFANGLKEFLGPGYLSKLERQVNQTGGLFEERQRYYLGRPTESPVWLR
jgi:hypothetical protein